MAQSNSDDTFKFILVQRIFKLLELIVWFCGIAGIVYLAIPLPLSYIAGKETVVDVVYDTIIALNLDFFLSTGAALVFLYLWRKERNLRKVTVKREHTRIEQFEKKHDPDRTSSGFEETPEGGSPEDR